jgi:hypothetical protein
LFSSVELPFPLSRLDGEGAQLPPPRRQLLLEPGKRPLGLFVAAEERRVAPREMCEDLQPLKKRRSRVGRHEGPEVPEPPEPVERRHPYGEVGAESRGGLFGRRELGVSTRRFTFGVGPAELHDPPLGRLDLQVQVGGRERLRQVRHPPPRRVVLRAEVREAPAEHGQFLPPLLHRQ